MKINAAIVDDERMARMRLRRLLTNLDVNIMAEGCDGLDALSLVNDNDIDILFIDINMPKLNGLEAVKKISQMGDAAPAIVFCTAYDEHAVEAFSTIASAYLLKPFTQEQLAQAIDKASMVSRLQINSIKGSESEIENIVLGNTGARQLAKWDDILFFYSENKFVFARLSDGQSTLIDKTLKQLEDQLGDAVVRVHRATLVNKSKMCKIFKDDTGLLKIQLESAEKRPEIVIVSRRHAATVKKCFI